MAASVVIEGVPYDVEKLQNGSIRVSFPSPPFNAMHGPDTDVPYSYVVHPCQRHQFDFWNAQLPPGERATIEPRKDENRPWWSFGSGHSGGSRE
jgi:hypothetical protein